MSMYIGDDNVGDTIFHVTKGPQDINNMRGSPIESTLIHTKSNLITAKKFDAVLTEDYPFTYLTFPSDFITSLTDGTNAFVYQIIVNDKLIDNVWFSTVSAVGNPASMLPPVVWSTAVGVQSPLNLYPNSTSSVGVIYSGLYELYEFAGSTPPTPITSVYALIYNMTADGTVINNNSQGEVLITNNEFTLGGNNFLDTLFISNKINDVDLEFSPYGEQSFQLINSSAPQTGIDFDVSNGVVIKNGTRKILDTSSTAFVLQPQNKQVFSFPSQHFIFRDDVPTYIPICSTSTTNPTVVMISVYNTGASKVLFTFLLDASTQKQRIGSVVFNGSHWLNIYIEYNNNEVALSSVSFTDYAIPLGVSINNALTIVVSEVGYY